MEDLVVSIHFILLAKHHFVFYIYSYIHTLLKDIFAFV